MVSRITVDLRNILSRQKFISGEDIRRVIMQSGEMVQSHLTQTWEKGLGGDELPYKAPFNKYSEGYEDYRKRHHLQTDKVALHFHGNLYQAIRPFWGGKLTLIIGVIGKYKKILEGLVKNRENIMTLSDKMGKKVVDFIYKKMIDYKSPSAKVEKK